MILKDIYLQCKESSHSDGFSPTWLMLAGKYALNQLAIYEQVKNVPTNLQAGLSTHPHFCLDWTPHVTQVIGQLQNLPDVCRSLVLFEWIDDFLSLKNYKTCLITMFGSQLLFMDFKKTKKLSFNPFLVHRLCPLDQNGF